MKSAFTHAIRACTHMNINIIYTSTYTNANFDYRINMVQK